MPSERARQLRKNPTDAERKLWSLLRSKQLSGFRFRRQVPIGPYIVDFFCPSARLIVKIDGGQHATQAAADAIRTRWLEAGGYRVLRYWNNDVLQNPDGIFGHLHHSLTQTSEHHAKAH